MTHVRCSGPHGLARLPQTQIPTARNGISRGHVCLPGPEMCSQTQCHLLISQPHPSQHGRAQNLNEAITVVTHFLGFPYLASRAFYYSIPTLTNWYRTSNLVIAIPSVIAALILAAGTPLKWGWIGLITVPLTVLLTVHACLQGKRDLDAGETISVMFLFSKTPEYGRNYLSF